MTATMRAAVARGGALALERVPLPEPDPGWVRVRLLACGICGTDLHFHHGRLWPEGHTAGHEMFGEVELPGDGVVGLAAGDRVAVEPLLACGRCDACLAGRANVCPEVRLLGIHCPGGFAEAICAPARRLYPVPADLDPALAALAEPVAVAVHGVRMGRLAAGQRVLVLGAGSIGLACVAAARAAGAGEVWLTARHDHQAEIGRALGADRVLRGDEAGAGALAARGREAPVDLVVETVGGAADTVRDAVAALRPGGTVSVLGLFFGDVAVPSLPMLTKEATLVWSNCYRRSAAGADFADAIALLEDRRDALSALNTHRVPLDRIEEGFALASDKTRGSVKVTVSLDDAR